MVQASETIYASPAKGIGLRGEELDLCYHGEYLNGQRHGHGVYKYPNGFFVYEGNYVHGKKHGNGKLSMKDGSYYEGEFKNDEIQGHGTRVFANGNSYIGQFETGEMHGLGVMNLANGDVYQGHFSRNQYHGSGTYRFANGDVYIGDFCNHKRTGGGEMAYHNGDRYEGEWINGLRHGEGRTDYANSDWYKGEWENDVFQGSGRLWISQTGITYDGTFDAGKPSQTPQKLNIYFITEELESGKEAAPVKGAKAAAATKEGADGGATKPLKVVLGEPVAHDLVIRVDQRVEEEGGGEGGLDSVSPKGSPKSAKAGPAAVKKLSPPKSPSTLKSQKTISKGGSAAAIPDGPPPPQVVNKYNSTEPPLPSGNSWKVVDMEHGRKCDITLHASQPQPLPDDQLLSCVLVWSQLEDDTCSVRVIISTSHLLLPPLPLCRPHMTEEELAAFQEMCAATTTSSVQFGDEDGAPPEPPRPGPVYGIQRTLHSGQCLLREFVIGCQDDLLLMAVQGGVGYLVASSPSVLPGFLSITLPEPPKVKPGQENKALSKTKSVKKGGGM